MKDSPRLIYRLLNEEDFAFYYFLNSHDKVMRYAYAEAFKNKEQAKETFDKVLNGQVEGNYGEQYIVLKKDTMDSIGIVDYEIREQRADGKVCEIGYFILPEYWGEGYAAEMGKSMVSYLFDNDKVSTITASCHAENKASEMTMIKIGMKKKATNKNGRYKDGKYADEICYGITKDEWSRTCR